MSTPASQLDLFSPSLDVVIALKASMARCLANCRLSRDEVVDRMNALAADAGSKLAVTKPTINKWVSISSTSHVIPTGLLPIFCKAVGSLEPLAVLAAPLGAAIAGPREQKLMQLGEAQIMAKQAQRQRRKALDDLEGLV